ncbi:diguanylate cyclase [Pseudoalteromonas mariniglutinosa]|uniref:sensor domain-containing diguanylate cyclase n=1 Tax=Pseudoalteromonas mariniglutinosa TaxID=206042 RepID=UPI00384D2F2D
MKCFLSLCGILIIIFFSHYSSAHSISVGKNFQYQQQLTIDYTLDTLSADMIVANTAHWQTVTEQTINLGIELRPLWIRISLENTEQTELPLILSIDNPLLDSVSVYHYHQQQRLLFQEIGDSLPLSNRQIKNESLLVQLTLPKASQTEVYLKIASNGGLRVPLSLWQPAEYLKYKSKFNLLYGLLVGFILALAITNVVLFAFSRKNYFAYAGILLTLLWLLLAYLYGFGYRYFHPNLPVLQQLTIPSLLLFATAMFMPMHRSICQPKSVMCAKIQYWLAVAMFCLACLIWLLATHIAIIVCLVMVPLVLIFYIFNGVVQFSQHNKQPCYAYLVALLAFFIAVIYLAIVVLSFFESQTASLSLIFFCFLICSLSLSYAVIKYFLLQRDAEVTEQQTALAQSKAQDILLQERLGIQEQARLDLEANIEERTFELQVTLRELEEKNRALEQLNMEDALTQTKNRRYFDKKLLMDIRRSRREQTPLSIIMLDIDNFKAINDNYGHLTGDQAIRAAADIIKQHLKRPLDEVARYGGEEFVMLMPNTPLAGALEIAETIRQAIENADIIVAGTTIKFTASIGIYSAIAEDINNPSLFTDCADKALYHAKQSGRNRVVSFPLSD